MEKCLTLCFDADDTLWDDGRYFSEAKERFLAVIRKYENDLAVVEEHFWKANERHRLVVGYGAHAFASAMVDTLHLVCRRGDQISQDVRRLEEIGHRLIYHPVACFDGVAETLVGLRSFGNLFMVTQGDHRYQKRKIEDSGIASLFDEICIVPEKRPEAYEGLMEQYGLIPANCWMIGNSPANDIQPALKAGMRAMYIPHPFTWKNDLIAIDGDYVELETIRDVLPFLRKNVSDES